MCAIDLEPCEIWRETAHRARRQRTCSCCHVRISPGEPYLSHFSVFEGDSCSQALCAPCWFARAQFADAHGTTPQPSIFPELLRECVIDKGDRKGPWRPLLAMILWRQRAARLGRIPAFLAGAESGR